MFGSAIIDIALGLAFMYLLVASMCLAVQEFAAAILATRAKVLCNALANLLKGNAGAGLFDQFMSHPMICAGSNAQFHQGGQPGRIEKFIRRTGAGRPSYVASATFRNVLVDLLLQPQADKAPAMPEEIEGMAKRAGMLPLPTPLGESSAGRPMLESIYNAVAQLPASNLQRALVIAMNDSRGDLDRAHAAIEAWFNSTMDRVSGWYKRRTQVFLAIYALIIVVCLNADTVMVGRMLAADPSARSAVAEFATGYVASHASPNDDCPDGPDPEGNVNATNFRRFLAVADQSRLPLGWFCPQPTEDPVELAAADQNPRRLPRSTAEYLFKALGLALTVLAASLGAPFWFDMVNKLVNLRGTGRPPDGKKPDRSQTAAAAPTGAGAQ